MRLLALLLLAGCAAGQLPPPDGAVPGPLPAGPADLAGPPAAPPRPFEERVIYFAMTDRFWNGDPANDERGAPGCFDPVKPRLFHGGDLAGLTQKIGYLEELGASALWVTPLNRQIPRAGESCGYHGYWADFALPDDGAIEEKLGTAAELGALLDALHARDIAFLLDLVVNHSGRQTARLLAERPGWFHDPSSCAGLGSGEVYCPLNGLPDFAQELPEVADYLDGMSRGWARRFAIDGIRLDTAKHVLPSYLRDRWVPAVRGARPGLFLLAEVFREGSARDLLPVVELGFDSAFHFPLRRALISSLAQGGSLDAVAGQLATTLEVFGAAGARRLVTFLDNHDVRRFLDEMTTPPAQHRARWRMALAALFTLPGVPQLYAGDELGARGAAGEDRRDMPAWAFDAAGRAAPHHGYLDTPAESFTLVQRLAALRREVRALTAGGYVELWRPNGGRDVLAFLRGDGPAPVIALFHNGTSPSGKLRVPLQTHPRIAPADKAALADGVVLEELLGEGAPATVTLTGGALEVELPPLTAALYRVR